MRHVLGTAVIVVASSIMLSACAVASTPTSWVGRTGESYTFLKWTADGEHITGQAIEVQPATGASAATTTRTSANLSGTINGTDVTISLDGQNLTGTVTADRLTLDGESGTYKFAPGDSDALAKDRARLDAKVTADRKSKADDEAAAKQQAYEDAQQQMLDGLPAATSALNSWKQRLAAKETAFTSAMAAVDHDLGSINGARCWTQDQLAQAETDYGTANSAYASYDSEASMIDSPADDLATLLDGVGLTGLSAADAARVDATKSLSASITSTSSATQTNNETSLDSGSTGLSNVDESKVCD